MTTLIAKTRSGSEISIIPQEKAYTAFANGKETKLSNTAFRKVNNGYYLLLNQFQVKSLLGITLKTDVAIEIITPDAEQIVKAQFAYWRESHSDILKSFKNDIIEGKIRVTIVIVGCDFPQAVLNIQDDYKGIKAFDAIYSLGEQMYHAYRWLPNELQFEGADVTELVAEKLKEIEIVENKASEKQANIESGCIYFHCESAPHDEDLSKVILNSPAPNNGSFTLDHRISETLFSRISQFGSYYSAEFLEDCDMFGSAPGWRFSKEAIEELMKTNRVFIDNIEVKNE